MFYVNVVYDCKFPMLSYTSIIYYGILIAVISHVFLINLKNYFYSEKLF